MKNKRSEKIKVVLVAPSMKIIGGQSIQAKRLLDAFSGDEKIQLEFVPNNPEAPFQKIKILRTISTSIKFWFLLFRKISKADIVHVFSAGTTSYIISTLPPLFIAKIFGKKTILNYHNGAAERHIDEWKLTAKPTMKMFDAIVSPSEFLVDVFAKFGLKAKAVFNFVESERFAFRERKSLEPVFLSNRNFESHYKVDDVLRAFRLIQNRFPEARLLIAGCGREENKLKKLAAELKLKNAEFFGKIENEEMPKLYDRADVYLNASVIDNMPLSIIEAFSCGVPVVSTDTGGIPYICENGETGLLVEKNDYKSLASEAVRLVENDALARKIVFKARRECAKYSWENVRGRWLKVYQDLFGTPDLSGK